MKTTFAALTAVSLIPAVTHAAILVQYHDGTASTAAHNEAAGITASNISHESQAGGFRTSFGGANATPAGPVAGSASGSHWMLWRKHLSDDALSPDGNYAGFTVTIGTAADGIILGDLSFDLAGAAANNAEGGIDVNYQVYAQVNGGGFSAIGSPSGFIELLGDSETNQFSSVETGVVSLSSLGALSTGDAIDIRIAIQSEDKVGAGNIGLFMQGIQLEAIPEPGSLVLLGLGGAALLGRYRRR